MDTKNKKHEENQFHSDVPADNELPDELDSFLQAVEQVLLENDIINQYPEIEKVVTLSRHLSWSHFLVLFPLKDQKERDFYGNFAYKNLIGVRELRKQIGQKIFERTENADIQNYNSNIIEVTPKSLKPLNPPRGTLNPQHSAFSWLLTFRFRFFCSKH